MSNILQGVLFILIYDIFTASKGVVLGGLLQTVHPILMIVGCFTLISIFFLLTNIKNLDRIIRICKEHYFEIILVNLSTAGAWFFYFYALKHIEPAIVSVIATAFISVFMVAFSKFFETDKPIVIVDVISSIGVFCSLMLVAYFCYDGLSAVQNQDKFYAIIGLSCAALTAFSVFMVTIVSKKLHRAGWDTRDVLAVRFIALIFLGLLFLPSGAQSQFMEFTLWKNILLITILGLIVPIYSLQKGTQKTDPLIVAFTISLLPIFFVFIQLFDNRLSFSIYSSSAIFLCLVFSSLGLYSRVRTNK